MPPFDGNGVFVTTVTTVSPATAGTTIDSAAMKTAVGDWETGLTNCVTKDGQQTITANLPMATYRHTGVGDAAALTDYASANQVVDGALNYGGASAAGTDTYAVSLPISPGAYTAGFEGWFIADVANTGACTINYNSVGARNLKMQDGNDPPDNFIIANALVHTKDDGTNAVIVGIPAVPVNTTSAQTLTNKTLTSPVIDTGVSGTAGVARIIVGSNVATTSGTTQSLGSSLPSWVKQIIVNARYVSISSTAIIGLRLGDSGGIETTGYIADAGTTGTLYGIGGYGSAIPLSSDTVADADQLSGSVTLTLQDASTNTWSISGSMFETNNGRLITVAGHKALSGTLTDVQLYTTGTAFDGGQANIVYIG